MYIWIVYVWKHVYWNSVCLNLCVSSHPCVSSTATPSSFEGSYGEGSTVLGSFTKYHIALSTWQSLGCICAKYSKAFPWYKMIWIGIMTTRPKMNAVIDAVRGNSHQKRTSGRKPITILTATLLFENNSFEDSWVGIFSQIYILGMTWQIKLRMNNTMSK